MVKGSIDSRVLRLLVTVMVVAVMAVGCDVALPPEMEESIQSAINSAVNEVLEAPKSNGHGNGEIDTNGDDTNEWLPDGVDELLQSVIQNEGNKGADKKYDRNEWTSSYQYYECDEDHECQHVYRSVRNYGFFESQWYDWDTNTYTDPYNGKTKVVMPDERPFGYDWDHLIPLAYVSAHGGENWTDEQKKAFADDPNVGLCVNAHDNRAKGAAGPSEWLPECNVADYCYSWLVIADLYGLALDEEDIQTIIECLDGVESPQVLIQFH